MLKKTILKYYFSLRKPVGPQNCKGHKSRSQQNFQVVLFGVLIFLRILLCHLLFFDTCYLVLLNTFFSPAKLFDAFLVKVRWLEDIIIWNLFVHFEGVPTVDASLPPNASDPPQL